MELVAFLGDDKENWGQVTALVKHMHWEKILLVKNARAEGFPDLPQCTSLEVNTDLPLVELKQELMEKLKSNLHDFEVALSIASGNGKEHMALIAALLSLPVGIRIVVFTKKGVEFIT